MANVSRFGPVIGTLTALLGVASGGGAHAAPAKRPPNVIVVMADDLGHADLGQDGAPIDTPALDRLAKEGVTFTHFLASAPLCSPTRAALLTGRYPHAVGMPGLASPAPREGVPVLGLEHSATTMPEALASAGYVSALMGKWHLGHRRGDWPRRHGFHEFWGSLLGTPGYYAAEGCHRDETPIEVTGYLTDRITDKALDFITRRRDKPFLLYLAYNAPHYPLEAPAALVYKYRRRLPAAGLYAIYAAMVERLDANIGRVLAHVDALGLRDETVIIFTSDNGPSAEDKGYGPAGACRSLAGLRGHKFSAHDGGLRVPFIARWPKRFPAGGRVEDVAVTMDIMPTVLQLAGVAVPPAVDGVSLVPVLTGVGQLASRTLHWETQDNLAALEGRWKYVARFFEKPALFDISADPGETRDLSRQHPDIFARLWDSHERWRQRVYPRRLPERTSRSAYHFPDMPVGPPCP